VTRTLRYGGETEASASGAACHFPGSFAGCAANPKILKFYIQHNFPFFNGPSRIAILRGLRAKGNNPKSESFHVLVLEIPGANCTTAELSFDRTAHSADATEGTPELDHQMQRATILRIFVASPSDLDDERKNVTDLIYEWNHTHSQSGVIAEPILWETHSRAASGDHPQDIIDRQLLRAYDCDVLLALFWSRLGSPTSSFESGTIQEIEQFSAMRQGDKDRVMLFFCTWPVPHNTDLKEFQRLKAFYSEAKKWSLCPEITDPTHFTTVVRRHLDRALLEIVSTLGLNDRPLSNSPSPIQQCGQALQRSLNAYEPLWKAALARSDDSAAMAILRTLASLVSDLSRQYEAVVPHAARWQQFVTFHEELQRFLTDPPVNTSDFWQGSNGLYNEFVALTHALQITQ
jgi:hypothetical protein